MANEQEPLKQTSTSSSGNKTLVIILVIVFAVILLGVGGYFGWKYLGAKIFNKSTTNVSPSPVVTVTVTASVTPTATPSLSSSKAISGDYAIADSDSRVIKEAELIDFTPWQLKVARNEIYARHGRPFVHKDLQCYFATKSWYTIDESFTESSLSTLENRNVATIKAYEEKIDSPLLQKDTGC